MWFKTPLLLTLLLGANTLCHPTAEPELEDRATPPYQTVHLTFHGGPASYAMTFTADGVKHPTNNALSVSIIDAPDFNALSQCTFYTEGTKALVLSISSGGVQQIIVGPPQPITAVACSGTCVPIYGMCYDTNGQYVGPCCNGYCAATRCRPWINPT